MNQMTPSNGRGLVPRDRDGNLMLPEHLPAVREPISLHDHIRHSMRTYESLTAAAKACAVLADPRSGDEARAEAEGLLFQRQATRPHLPITAVHVREAKDALQSVPMAGPAHMRLIAAFLEPLAIALASKKAPVPDSEEMLAYAGWLAWMCDDLPGFVWTKEVQRALLMAFSWWPAPKEISDIVRERAVPALRLISTLRGIADAMPADADIRPAEETPKLCQEVRDAILAKFRSDMAGVQAEWAAARPDAAKEPVPAKPLMPDHLAALRDSNPLVQRAREAQARKAGQ